ncbi:MAG: hypothetical protein AAB432_00885 [Patescibacteria group bacterium]
MNSKRNKNFATVTVTIIIVGLIGTYVPLLFTRPPIISNEELLPSEVASLVSPIVSQTQTTSTPTSTKPNVSGFGGLDEETKLLDNLGN